MAELSEEYPGEPKLAVFRAGCLKIELDGLPVQGREHERAFFFPSKKDNKQSL